jgi:hypothetical protein
MPNACVLAIGDLSTCAVEASCQLACEFYLPEWDYGNNHCTKRLPRRGTVDTWVMGDGEHGQKGKGLGGAYQEHCCVCHLTGEGVPAPTVTAKVRRSGCLLLFTTGWLLY